MRERGALRFQIIVKAVAAFFKAIFFVEAVGLGAWHAAVKNKAFATAFFGEVTGMVHELDAIALTAFVFVGNNARNVTGHSGKPEGVEVGAVAKAVIATVIVHEEEGKAIGVANHIAIDLANHVLIIGVVGPELLDIIKSHVKIVYGCVFVMHNQPILFILFIFFIILL